MLVGKELCVCELRVWSVGYSVLSWSAPLVIPLRPLCIIPCLPTVSVPSWVTAPDLCVVCPFPCTCDCHDPSPAP